MDKDKITKPDVLLNLGDGHLVRDVKEDVISDIRIGELFQFEGTVYDVTYIKHHDEDGKPYDEVILF